MFALDYEDCLPMDEHAARHDGLLQTIGNKEVDNDYIRMVLGLLVAPDLVRAQGSRLKIIYTPLHGSGNVPVRRALREAGITQVSVVPTGAARSDFPTVRRAWRIGCQLASLADEWALVFCTQVDRLGV